MKFLCLFILLSCTSLFANDLRDQANEYWEDGKNEKAIESYQKLVTTVSDDESGDDIHALVEILRDEKREDEVDELLEGLSRSMRTNPHAMLGIARSYKDLSHDCYFMDGEVVRGERKDFDGGSLYHYDYCQRFAHYEKTRKLVEANPEKTTLKFKREFYLEYLDFLLIQTHPEMLEQLTKIDGLSRPKTLAKSGLSDEKISKYLEELNESEKMVRDLLPPIGSSIESNSENTLFNDFSPQHRESNYYDNEKIFNDKKPLKFHLSPLTFAQAKNDGERMQFIRAQARELHEKTRKKVDFMYALYIQKIYGEYIPYVREGEKNILHKLTDDQVVLQWVNKIDGGLFC